MGQRAFFLVIFVIFQLCASAVFAKEASLELVVAELELAKAASEAEVVKAASELEIAKASAQVDLVKAAGAVELARARSDLDLVKAAEQFELVKASAEVDEAVARGKLAQARALAELELAKRRAQVELTKAALDVELARALVEGATSSPTEESPTVEVSQEKSLVNEEPVDVEPQVELNEDSGEFQESTDEKPLQLSQTGRGVFDIKGFFVSVSEHFGRSLWANSPYTKVGLYSIADLCSQGYGVVFQDEAMIFDTECVSNSVGVGFRKVDCQRRLFGGYVFYDFLKGCRPLHQIGIVGEFRGRCLEAYCNVFFPVARQSGFGKSCFFDNYSGPFWVNITPVEYLFRGVEFAVGKRGCFCSNIHVDGYIGGYYLENTFGCRTLGFQALGEVCWCSRFFGGFFLAQDNFCGRRVEGYCGITIPFSFGCHCKSNEFLRSCCCLRDGIIPRFGTGVRGCAANFKKNW